jgi:large subunit ribosomal protein L33
MVKVTAIVVKLVSMAGTGFCYYTKKNPKLPKKLMLRKHDPVVNAHVLFKVPQKFLFQYLNIQFRKKKSVERKDKVYLYSIKLVFN